MAIRQDIIKFITDRPHRVVTRDEIIASGGWSATQVTHSILSVQRDTSLGSEIETIVRGNAWRYVPRNGTSTTEAVQPAPNRDLPLTTLIRQYMIAHPYEVITVDQLVTYTGKRVEQVKVGVNNMRNIASNADVSAHVTVVVHGQMWRFEPPTDWRPGNGVRPTTGGRPSTATYVPSPVVTTATTATTATNHVAEPDDEVDDSGQGRVFEEIGSLRDGRIVIRDQHDNMYTAAPIQQDK